MSSVLELLLALFIGVLIGLLAGLLPGLHPNTLIPILLGAAVFLEPAPAAIILVTAGVVNTFVNFVPSIFLGAPEDDTALSVLPGHKLLMEGRGHEAIKLTVIGGLGAVVLSILLLPLFIAFVPSIYNTTRPHLWWILSVVILYMVLTERKFSGKAFGLLTVLLSGALGLIVLNDIGNGMLFPMLSGLFGIPMLLLSARRKVRMPEHMTFEEERLPRSSVLSGILSGTTAGIVVGLLPGIGSAQAAVLTQMASERTKQSIRRFLIALGGVNTADIIFSLFALWLIGNPRSGIAVAVSGLIGITLPNLYLLVSAIVCAAGIGAYFTLKLSRKAVTTIRKFDYPKVCIYTAAFILLLVGLFTGPLGLAVAAVSTAIGLIPNLTEIRRSHAMGCLLVPTILFFL